MTTFTLFGGLPLGWQILFTVALVVIVGMFLWTSMLFVRAWRAAADPPPVPPGGADTFQWVFLVPALNEEVTIRDSVERLLRIPLDRRWVVVIDDGSDDRTAEILDDLEHPDLAVLRRDLPNARQGKAEALNDAYRFLDRLLGDLDRSQVIVVIVDADGRLHPTAPGFAAAHFADPTVGGVQSLVRIYNRRRPITWLQDVEFSVYGHLFQAGRDDWGTAGMGGNAQFNRLSALDDIAENGGPWRSRLTEDQDLGLRLIARGWRGRQDLRATVDQQGPPTLRALFRQRTRWAQGNLQAIGLLPQVARAPLPAGARVEVLAYLLMPVWQGIVAAALVGAFVLALFSDVPLVGAGPWRLLIAYLLAFSGTVLGCIAARRTGGARGWLAGFAIGHVYALYTWMLLPVFIRAAVREAAHQHSWAKTERAPLELEGASQAHP